MSIIKKIKQHRFAVSVASVAVLGLLISGAISQLMPVSEEMSRLPIRGTSGIRNLASEGFGHGKAHQPLRMDVEAIGDIPESADETLKLKVSLQTSRSPDGESQFVWVLPQGASIVSGEARGRIHRLEPGEIWTQEVLVKGVTDTGDLQRVKFDFATEMDGAGISSQAYFISHPMKRDLSRARMSDELKRRQGLQKRMTASESNDSEDGTLPKGIQF